MTVWHAALLVQAQAAFGLNGIPPKLRDTFLDVAQEEFCGCNSALTLAGCLELRPACTLSQHLGKLVLRGLENGTGKDAMLGFLSERIMGPYCAKPIAIDASKAPAMGPRDAPVTIIEFADFRCAHCRQAAAWVHALRDSMGARVQVVFVPFPVQDHPFSVAAAEAALAALEQDKFPAMHDALFSHTSGDLDPKTIEDIAARVGLDMQRFQKSMRDHTQRPLLAELKQRGVQAGVNGTPAFFVNGRPLKPDRVLLTLEDRVQLELARNQQEDCQ